MRLTSCLITLEVAKGITYKYNDWLKFTRFTWGEETWLQESKNKLIIKKWVTSSADDFVSTAFMKGCKYFTPAAWMAGERVNNTYKPWKLPERESYHLQTSPREHQQAALISTGNQGDSFALKLLA